ncbi:Type 1 glutamine amidotransferase-like domain-containing protein [Paenibacillus gallinarum]|uniref:Peptidase E n=1 Tax=Paenibacillus gallinarum TaxID=2762232 RepID=A0ABR8SXJ8_9BACL|nr:peptidase E [Paenibacillus gallinarum]MBD7968227.1 peptidase E [Paenibacillus gallinarum]
MTSQIIAMGGGGFSMEPDNLLLDKYILDQSISDKPKVCFLPTASGDAEGYVKRFYAAFDQHCCIPSHLSLSSPPNQNLEDFVLDKDIIYVGGGSTKNLLALWKELGLDQILTTAWKQGIVLAGLSAGSLCWYEEGITDSNQEGYSSIRCLGLLPGSHSPHYDDMDSGEYTYKPAYRKLVEAGELKQGVAADNGTALHYIGTDLYKVVSSRRNAFAYQVSRTEDGLLEKKLEPHFLGNEKKI